MLLVAVLPGCSSIGDFGRLSDALVTDDIHAWVGEEAAASAGAPISADNLTDDEHTLRDLAFPLIEPPYDRLRWDAVVYEYGTKKSFQRKLWAFDPTAYYRHLQANCCAPASARYNQLIDDIRNDIVRIEPFFMAARRVVDLDRRREASMEQIASLTSRRTYQRPGAHRREQLDHRLGAQTRSTKDAPVIVLRSNISRSAEPEPVAAVADRVLTRIAAADRGQSSRGHGAAFRRRAGCRSRQTRCR